MPPHSSAAEVQHIGTSCRAPAASCSTGLGAPSPSGSTETWRVQYVPYRTATQTQHWRYDWGTFKLVTSEVRKVPCCVWYLRYSTLHCRLLGTYLTLQCVPYRCLTTSVLLYHGPSFSSVLRPSPARRISIVAPPSRSLETLASNYSSADPHCSSLRGSKLGLGSRPDSGHFGFGIGEGEWMAEWVQWVYRSVAWWCSVV